MSTEQSIVVAMLAFAVLIVCAEVLVSRTAHDRVFDFALTLGGTILGIAATLFVTDVTRHSEEIHKASMVTEAQLRRVAREISEWDKARADYNEAADGDCQEDARLRHILEEYNLLSPIRFDLVSNSEVVVVNIDDDVREDIDFVTRSARESFGRVTTPVSINCSGLPRDSAFRDRQNAFSEYAKILEASYKILCRQQEVFDGKRPPERAIDQSLNPQRCEP